MTARSFLFSSQTVWACTTHAHTVLRAIVGDDAVPIAGIRVEGAEDNVVAVVVQLTFSCESQSPGIVSDKSGR